MPLSVDQFVRRLVEAELLPRDELDEFVAALDPPPADGEQLANALVRQRKLTKYQAQVAYAGDGRPLALGNYVILDRIGAGGMGEVFLAQHRRLGRKVALKVLPAKVTGNPEAVHRFHREVQAIAKLSHPNIVAAFDAGESHGTHYCVMEYVDGRDLASIVKQDGPLDAGRAIDCLLQAAAGLEYAHQQHVIHRDIKPSNLLLQRSEVGDRRSEAGGQPLQDHSPLTTHHSPTVKVLDLGLARFEQSDADSVHTQLTNTGTVMGTVDYMAPEQALNTKNADARSDVYSLGCTLFYLLSGRAVYRGETVIEKVLAHREEPIPSLADAARKPSAILEPLDSVFRKMVAKKPADRYQSMAEVIAALLSVRDAAQIPSDPDAGSIRVAAPETEPELRRFFAGMEQTATYAEPQPAPGMPLLDGRREHVSVTETLGRRPSSSATALAPQPPVEETVPSAQFGETFSSLGLTNRPRKTWRDYLHDRNVQVVGGGAVACVLLVLVAAVFFGGRQAPEEPEHRSNTDAGNGKSTPTPKQELPADELPDAAMKRLADMEEKKRLAEQTAARKKWIAAEQAVRRQRGQEADVAFAALDAKFHAQGVTFASFAKDVAAFKAKHGGTRAAIKAAELLMRLPSPLDRLKPAEAVPEAVIAQCREIGFVLPKELVAVVGETDHRRQWSFMRWITASPDGKTVAAGGSDGIIHLWDPKTWARISTLRGHQSPVTKLAFTVDSKTLVSGDYNGDVRLWNVANNPPKLLHVLTGHTRFIHGVAFTRDGRRLATTSWDRTTRVWDLTGIKPTQRQVLEGYAYELGFLNEGSILAFGTSSGVQRWEVRGSTAKQLSTLDDHSSPVVALAIAPTGRQMATGGNDEKIRLWRVAGEKMVVMSVLEGHGGNLEFLNFSPDGKSLASSAWDGTVRVWDLASGRERCRVRHFDGAPTPAGIAISANSRTLFTTGDGTIRLWDISSGKELLPLARSARFPIVISAEDRLLATGSDGRTIQLWDLTAVPFKSRMTLRGHSPHAMALTPDGTLLASGEYQGENLVRVWSLTTGLQRAPLTGHGTDIPSCSFHPHGKLLASASYDGTARIWDLASGKAVRSLHHGFDKVNAVRFSPDGRIIATATVHSTIRLWNADTGEIISELSGIPSQARAVAFHPDGRTLASIAEKGEVWVWDVATGIKLRTLEGLNGKWTWQVSFSPDGKLLAASDDSGNIVVWNTATGSKRISWKFPGTVWAVHFANDGRHLATANGNGTVYILRLPKPQNFALSFDGKDDYVEIPTLKRQLGEPITVEVRVYPMDIPRKGWRLAISLSPPASHYLQLNEGQWSSVGLQKDRWREVRSNSPAVARKWVHVAGVFDATGTTLYIDGKRQDVRKASGDLTANPSRPAYIGNPQWPFHGLIDQVRISKTARYTKDFTPTTRFTPDKDTLALYHFDEGRGDKLTDSSGNGHHGRIHGATWVNADGTAIKR